MYRNVVLCALVSAAMISTSALAHGAGPGGGHGGGNGGGNGMGNAGGLGGGVGAGAGGMNNSFGMETRDASRINSQGPENASASGMARANSNSVLANGSASAGLNKMFPETNTTTSVTVGTFAGLTTGMTLMSNGAAVGTVQQIRTTRNGSVAVVIVKGTNGGLFAIPANKLTLSSGVLSTTSRLAGINSRTTTALNNPAVGHSQALMHASTNGISHANFHSVLARSTVVRGSLAGLTTGLMVRTSGGTTLGTVSQIVTDSSGNIRLVIVRSSTGRTFRLLPTSLALSGGVVTTTQSVG